MSKHSKFQLFLSSKPTNKLELTILHKCIKVTLEPSKGLKINMTKIISNLVPDYELDENRDTFDEFIFYKKLVFGLSWFHSILNERKRFKYLGWNKPYEFTDSDFLFSEKMLKEFVNGHERLNPENFQWDSINYLFAKINYGGRVTDLWDQRLLNEYSKEIFQKQLLLNNTFMLETLIKKTDFKELTHYEEI